MTLLMVDGSTFAVTFTFIKSVFESSFESVFKTCFKSKGNQVVTEKVGARVADIG